ncbi:MAG: response regulator receiver protein [Myxococcaceae bacterium]|nr:response regulator receiver protein [Myxococcaceae bacterium]
MKRILVIDDDVEINELVGKVLVRAGYQVRTAANGEDGLEILREFSADLIIVDKNLPRMHGAEVIREARRRFPFIGVILITAFPEPFALGQDRLNGYLGKPFKSLKAIEDAVAQALDSADEIKHRDELKSRLSQVMAELTPGAKKRP